MASRLVLLLGNITSILLTIIAFLQFLSWTIAGLLILATLTITTVAPSSPRTPGTTHPGPKRSTNHPAASETKNHRDQSIEKLSTHTHTILAKPEAKPPTKFEPSKTLASQTKPEPPKIAPAKISTVKINPPIVTPPKSIPSVVSPSKTLPAKSNPPSIPSLRPIPPTLTPTKPSPVNSSQPTSLQKPSQYRPESNMNPTITKGDYTSYDIDLDGGVEVTCEVISNGEVNLYILDQENLNSLDVGEEFWSETGEEAVEKATLHFTAPEKGKWFLIIENADTKEVSATVNIRRARSSTASVQGLG